MELHRGKDENGRTSVDIGEEYFTQHDNSHDRLRMCQWEWLFRRTELVELEGSAVGRMRSGLEKCGRIMIRDCAKEDGGMADALEPSESVELT